jgi:KDO2-lipid IV(A) lauroyltransferase
MKKDSIIDYLAYIAVKLLGPVVRRLPISFSLFLGRRLGDLLYCLDLKHKAIAYSNIKVAFGQNLSSLKLSQLTRKFYLTFGQNLIEILLIPLVNKQYFNKYISFEGLEFIEEAFKYGKGVVFLSIHAGSWELSNVICANLGFPFRLFIRNQGFRRLNALLNQYRRRKGCKIIERQNDIRQLIEAVKKNEAVGMTMDQGGRTGVLVKFFGRQASMATGALRLALKYGSVILPVFYMRVNGPYIKAIIEPPFKIKKTGELQRDIQDNLQQLTSIFEKYIRMYPREYLWSYKIWKYGKSKFILILSDGKPGHLIQAQALANIASSYLREKGVETKINTQEVKFKGKLSRGALAFSSCLSGKYHCQGCLWCLRTFLEYDVYKSLCSFKPDVIISCGSSVAPVNYILSRENLAKSITIMRPTILSASRFDLVVMPEHDRPPRRKNVAVTQGALNSIDEEYLKGQSKELLQAPGSKLQASGFYIGLLIGGDTKGFSLNKDTMLGVIKELKAASRKLDADILLTTSRRTSKEIENIIKEEFKDYPPCKLLVIANEKNIPGVVGGILGLSQIVISSPESVSMVSEAINSKRYVLVFSSPGLNKRHQRFLEGAAKNKYIYLTEAFNLSRMIEQVWRNKPLRRYYEYSTNFTRA